MSSKRIKMAALRIALIQEEFSARELQEALLLLDRGSIGPTVRQLKTGARPGTVRRKSVSNTIPRNKAIRWLQESDPEKYAALSDFEVRLRRGDILPSLDDVKEFAIALGVELEGVRSRKNALPRLLTELADKDLKTFRRAVAHAEGARNDDGAFSQLAEYIVSGTSRRQKADTVA